MDKNLYAVDQQTGALKWKFAAEGSVVSSRALAGGIVYFASYDGKFYALDAATGRLEWTFKTDCR
jgi:eukaryotic-like serine/threonine-protein kinase